MTIIHSWDEVHQVMIQWFPSSWDDWNCTHSGCRTILVDPKQICLSNSKVSLLSSSSSLLADTSRIHVDPF